MDRELLLEIGCEELPASWLPRLTNQIGEMMAAALSDHRLPPESPVESFSTPRRLTVRVARVPERQTDFEELVTGPPVSAGFKPDGTPTPAAAGFAAKQGVDVGALERVRTPKGEYLAYRKRLRGRTTVDVLPGVLGSALRALTFPKLMRWDAILEDGHGELPFGRPIRWILYLYGGRVVPFNISRTSAAQTSQVQDVSSGAVTYGHRFLTTSGRAGRAIKVRSFDEYRARLLENFVILERSERHDKIARELDAKAQRLHGRVSRVVRGEAGLLHEVPDLVEYPAVVAGTFAHEFLELPEEVLTTTLIHHQHYFPVEDEDGTLKNAFLAVINTEPDNERTISTNAERVVTARLRDARFFWEADRKVSLESRVERLGTLVFHKKLGTYKDKAGRIHTLAGWIAEHALGGSGDIARQAADAARLAKADLATDMVREFTELQGTMGGIYARHEGQQEEVWKAIYYHYLPVGVEADAPPTRAQLGKAALTWTAVSLADKLDTVAGMFSASEKPTGSRDPFGIRRAAQGIVKILADLDRLHLRCRVDPSELLRKAFEPFTVAEDVISDASGFLWDRTEHLHEQRGAARDALRAVRSRDWALYYTIQQTLDALETERHTKEFKALAALFKRVRNITKDVKDDGGDLRDVRTKLKEPAELALADAVVERERTLQEAVGSKRMSDAIASVSALYPLVDRFFVDVLVMADDPVLRDARLALLARLYRLIRQNIGDISEMAPETGQD